jgi:hypothetical protein
VGGTLAVEGHLSMGARASAFQSGRVACAPSHVGGTGLAQGRRPTEFRLTHILFTIGSPFGQMQYPLAHIEFPVHSTLVSKEQFNNKRMYWDWLNYCMQKVKILNNIFKFLKKRVDFN